MPMETRSNSALFKRAEQLKRWEDSETNKETELPRRSEGKIKFTDGCVFLAACAAGDTEEVERLLEKGADINTANVDGLTALHQACIDDNLKMVEFLVEHGCDVDRGDNEGWTPLHATASCGFLSIAKYLLENGASVAKVNNDGELPIDIAESEEMEELLQAEIDHLGIDCDAARTEEERVMMQDAQDFQLKNQNFNDKIHPKTGATALHVAAAKGYIKVLSLLIKAGLDLNTQDNDGWTPLHAAAHWGQKESCELLADNLANMDIQNFVGQTCFDVADPDLVSVLEDLKKKQNTLQKERPELGEILRRKAPPPLKRRTSVTRMSGTDKSNVIMKDTFAERAQIEAKLRLPEEEVEEESKVTDESVPEPSSNIEIKTKEDLTIVKRNESNIADEHSEDKAKEIESPVSKPPTDAEIQELPNDAAPWRRKGETNISLTQGTQDTAKEEPLVVLRKLQEVQTAAEDKKANGPTYGEAVDQRIPSTKEDAMPSPSIINASAPSTPSSNLSSPSTGVTTPPLEGQIRRSFVPPVRDEESETRRKAHAKRVRETRRSTTGVTLEDLKSAEQQLLRKQQEEDEQKENEKEHTETTTATTLAATTTTTVTASSAWERQGSLRKHAEDSKKAEQTLAKQSQNITDTRSTPSSTTNVSTTSITVPSPVHTREHPQVSSVTDSPEVTHSVTIPLRTRPGQNDDLEKDYENKIIQGTQAAIQRRRRPKRRSTGVVYLDSEDQSDQQSSPDQELQQDEKQEDEQSQESEGDRETSSESQRSHFGSIGTQHDNGHSETPKRYTDRLGRSSLNSSTGSLAEEGDQNYKKICETLKSENARLKENLKKTEEELVNTKRQLQKALLQNHTRSSLSDAEKRERRALERKAAEMEEELKQLEQVKAENQRLRDENGALIRVISKLSK
ncbi:protein phosphatase 1 regulatory subunit 12B-like isoform X1 [Limulus polyphemus]|uniref:Protein phosphatase 1 regulatory subunit 12B-like isoform X1 n=1 Tax=Limulus polyphemus TaxID=6850 RepID=A0ABM1BHV5_LIMPO|nr:protein phosphatase 1 regulatory subunit 12B-like isoform X1 [Limulus polyphemus]